MLSPPKKTIKIYLIEINLEIYIKNSLAKSRNRTNKIREVTKDRLFASITCKRVFIQSVLENVVYPNSVDVLLISSTVKTPKPFNSVVFKTSAKFISVSNIQGAKPVFLIHTEFSLVV